MRGASVDDLNNPKRIPKIAARRTRNRDSAYTRQRTGSGALTGRSAALVLVPMHARAYVAPVYSHPSLREFSTTPVLSCYIIEGGPISGPTAFRLLRSRTNEAHDGSRSEGEAHPNEYGIGS